MKEQSKYQQIEPKSDNLRKFIKLYYVHHSTNDDIIERTTYFPNYMTTINIYENSKVTWNDTSRTHESCSSDNYLKLLVSKFDKSREIIMSGAFNKLTIVFTPLGLNHFLTKDLSEISEDHFSFFSHFGKSFDQALKEIFSTNKIEKKRDLLDDYFSKVYVGFEETRLNFAVNQIIESNGVISINEISQKLNLSRKTLLRLFKKHLSYSPSEYKSIVKFRKALESYQTNCNKLNFSELAHENFYYDQSDLNFHFKDKTGLTPQQLFSAVKTIEQGLYWKAEHVPKVQDSI